MNECDSFDCGDGTCQNKIGSHSCNCFDGFTNYFNDPSQICGNYSLMFREEDTRGCSIDVIDNTALIYSTGEPYGSEDKCSAVFQCKTNQTLVYSFDRFELEGDRHISSVCYDILTFNGIEYCTGVSQPPMLGVLSISGSRHGLK